MNMKTKETLITIASTVLMVIIALVLGAVLIVLSGNQPGEAYGTLLRGAFGSEQKITELFVKLIPLLIMSLGISIAFKASLWNIGATGQFTVGAIAAVAVALYMPGPIFIKMIISFIAAVAAGAFWAGLAGWLKVKFNANEVITTLMLNYVGTYLLMWLINGPMQDPNSDLSQSDLIPDGMRLTRLFGEYRLHTGIFILIAIVLLVLIFWKTSLGYQVDLIGQGDKVSTYAGVNVKKTTVLTMMISGGIIAVAGWIEIFGIQYRLLDGLAADYGDTANIIALLGSLSVYGIIVAAAFFSILLCGGASMQRMTEVPYSVVDVMQGLIIVFVIARTNITGKVTKLFTYREVQKQNEKEKEVE